MQARSSGVDLNTALRDCMAIRGSSCEGNKTSLCDTCQNRETGLERRRTRVQREQEETIAQVEINGRLARARQMGTRSRTIEFGRLGAGGIFSAERQIPLSDEELDLLKLLLFSDCDDCGD